MIMINENHFNEEGKESPLRAYEDESLRITVLLPGELLLKTFDLITKVETPLG